MSLLGSKTERIRFFTDTLSQREGEDVRFWIRGVLTSESININISVVNHIVSLRARKTRRACGARSLLFSPFSHEHMSDRPVPDREPRLPVNSKKVTLIESVTELDRHSRFTSDDLNLYGQTVRGHPIRRWRKCAPRHEANSHTPRALQTARASDS